jgi:23S rRNA (pseudouridine1915-N3)-methyltransferase
MKISIITVGKLKEKYFKDAVAEYAKRLSRFVSLSILEVPDEKIPDKASEKQEELIRKKEGDSILAQLKENSYKIALCIEGQQLPSEKLAKKIADISMQSSHITFIIGGSLGLSEEVKKQADYSLSFGAMTLPHQLMRVVLLEQIYRSYKINHNENYHK